MQYVFNVLLYKKKVFLKILKNDQITDQNILGYIRSTEISS